MQEVENTSRILWSAMVRPAKEVVMENPPSLVTLGHGELPQSVVLAGLLAEVGHGVPSVLLGLFHFWPVPCALGLPPLHHLGGHHHQQALLLPDHVVEVAPGAPHTPLGGDVLLVRLVAPAQTLLLMVDVVGVDVVVAGLLAHPTENNSRVVERKDILVPGREQMQYYCKSYFQANQQFVNVHQPVLCLVLRPLPLLPAVQVLALLLLQTLELLPETGLAWMVMMIVMWMWILVMLMVII